MKKQFALLTALILSLILVFSACAKSDATNSPTEEELSADANKFVEELAAGNYSEAKKNHSYAFVMNMLTGEKTLKTIWETLTKQYGEYVSIYEYEYEAIANYESIIIKVAFDTKSVDFKVTYSTGTLQISGLHYSPNADKPELAGADVPQPPEGVLERTFHIGSQGLELPAILAYPEGGERYPLVVLVHGSGPNDANETIGRQAPFRDIAWGLAQQGIAVLRYDKRTLVYPESFGDESTAEQETVEDAMIAAITAQTMPEVMPGNIFILGHSLGGTMIPRIAQITPEASGFIMMGAAVTPLNELMVEQYEYIFNLDEKLTLSERISLLQAKKMSKNVSALTDDSTKKADSLFGIAAPYWLYFKKYDMLELAQSIQKPLLVLQGESDYQVPMRDFNAIQDALSGNENASFISYPGLGHLMTQAGSPPSPDDYYEALNVSQQVIDDIADFVKGN